MENTIRMGDGIGPQEQGPTEQHPRTSNSGTCLWCGKQLRLAKSATLFKTSHRGAYGDNAFCTIRCGYCFGVAMAMNGDRLKEGTEALCGSSIACCEAETCSKLFIRIRRQRYCSKSCSQQVRSKVWYARHKEDKRRKSREAYGAAIAETKKLLS